MFALLAILAVKASNHSSWAEEGPAFGTLGRYAPPFQQPMRDA